MTASRAGVDNRKRFRRRRVGIGGRLVRREVDVALEVRRNRDELAEVVDRELARVVSGIGAGRSGEVYPRCQHGRGGDHRPSQHGDTLRRARGRGDCILDRDHTGRIETTAQPHRPVYPDPTGRTSRQGSRRAPLRRPSSGVALRPSRRPRAGPLVRRPWDGGGDVDLRPCCRTPHTAPCRESGRAAVRRRRATARRPPGCPTARVHSSAAIAANPVSMGSRGCHGHVVKTAGAAGGRPPWRTSG
jgi:hypothetical protein